MLRVWVIDDQIGIGTNTDRTLARIEPEELGGFGGTGADHRVEIDFACENTKCVDEIDSFLDGWDAVGDFGEGVFAHDLLIAKVEWGMIGADRGDRAGLEPVPERILITLLTQWWRHDILRADKVGLLGVGFVENEMRRDGFDPDIDASELGIDRGLHRRCARGMNNVDMSTGQLGKGREMMHAFGFDADRARWLVPLRAGLAFADEQRLHRVDQVGVLAMGGGDYAEILGHREKIKEIRIVEIEGAFVGEEDLEGCDSVLGDDRLELFLGKIVEADNRHVEGVIECR